MTPQLEIHVDGNSSVFRTAERGVVHLSISSTSTDQSQAFTSAQTTVAALTHKFRTHATKTDDGRPHPTAGITTFTVAALNTSSRYPMDKNYREIRTQPKEHTVRSTAEVVFRNLDLLSELSHELATMPHVAIVSSEWRLTEATRAAIEREARVKAIQNAVQKAEDYAGVVGRKVVAVEIRDGPSSGSAANPRQFLFGGGGPQMQQMQMQQQQQIQARAGAMAAGVAAEGPAALEPRTISVTAQVNARFISNDS